MLGCSDYFDPKESKRSLIINRIDRLENEIAQLTKYLNEEKAKLKKIDDEIKGSLGRLGIAGVTWALFNHD